MIHQYKQLTAVGFTEQEINTILGYTKDKSILNLVAGMYATARISFEQILTVIMLKTDNIISRYFQAMDCINVTHMEAMKVAHKHYACIDDYKHSRLAGVTHRQAMEVAIIYDIMGNRFNYYNHNIEVATHREALEAKYLEAYHILRKEGLDHGQAIDISTYLDTISLDMLEAENKPIIYEVLLLMKNARIRKAKQYNITTQELEQINPRYFDNYLKSRKYKHSHELVLTKHRYEV